jgi:hypothetical protein
MDSGRGNGGGKRTGGNAPVTAYAMGEYVDRLSKGANHGEAAAAAGHSTRAFQRLRKRDSAFAAACDEALLRSSGKRFVRGSNGRKLQLRRGRHTEFTLDRQVIFLGHFAGTGNVAEAADMAGVCENTIDKHRRRDPDFNRIFLETLDQVYVKLEADLVARRVAAQRQLRDIEPTGELDPEFDRAMKLLQRWDRRQGPPDSRAFGDGARKRWEFCEALALLEKKLRNMGYPIEPLPPGHERPDDPLPLPPSGLRSDGKPGSEGEEGE